MKLILTATCVAAVLAGCSKPQIAPPCARPRVGTSMQVIHVHKGETVAIQTDDKTPSGWLVVSDGNKLLTEQYMAFSEGEYQPLR